VNSTSILNCEAVFEQSSVAMAIRDAHGRYQRVNQAFCRFVGYDAHELATMTVYDVTHPADVEQHRELSAELEYGELADFSLEQRYVRKDGRIVWGRVAVSKVRDDASRAIAYSVVVRDVSEQKRLISELADARAFGDAIIDAAPVAILVLDHAGRIMRMNAFLSTLSGITQNDALGRDGVALLIEPDRHDFVRARIIEAVADSVPRTFVLPIRTRGAGSAIVRWSSSPLQQDQGATGALLLVGEDLSERRRIEAHLRAVDHLAHIGTMTAGLGHDLANVVFAMRTALAHLRQKETVAETRALATLETGTDWLAQIWDALRLIVRAGRDDEVKLVDLNALWQRTQPVLAMLLPIGITLRSDISPDTPSLRSNESLLMRAILNLVVNAAQAIGSDEESRGEITVSAARDPDDPAMVRIGVQDDGPGIDPMVRARIFEPFVGARPGSTGLGLAIVKTFAERSGGLVSVESTPGQGALFLLRLPFEDASRSPTAGSP
jgi:PAS domain S-box-containing protein